MKRKNKSRVRKLAVERIERLFELAEEEHALHPERSDRYVEIARRVSTRVRIRMPKEYKRMFCKHCGCYLTPSTKRVRLSDGVLTVTCTRCGRQMRYPYRGL